MINAFIYIHAQGIPEHYALRFIPWFLAREQ